MILDDASRGELEALLRWYVDMGVDVAIDGEPHDRFAEALAARQAKSDPVSRPVEHPPRAPLR